MAPTGENFRKLALLNCLKQVFFKAFKENLDESKNFPFALKKGGRAKARVAPPVPWPLHSLAEIVIIKKDKIIILCN